MENNISLSDINFENNLFSSDLFKAEEKREKCHIRVQQRNARKYITIIEGLSPDIDLKKVLKCMKKTLSCHGCIKTDKDENQIIQLSGDQRRELVNFLVENKIVENKADVVIHGF